MLEPLTADLLTHDGVSHGFFTRVGGASFGRGDLNCGPKSGDNPDDLAHNRALVTAHLGGSLEGVDQFHSTDVLTIKQSLEGKRPAADALVTNVPRLAISVLSADCGPILFLDPHAQVIGAAHSGWRGAVGNIAARTVEAMETLGADRHRIRAVLGPTIAQVSYEVGPDFLDTLAETVDDPTPFVTPSPNKGHWMFDLPAFIGAQLGDLVGLSQVLDADTYALEHQFFSYRRDMHRNQPGIGRQISGICLHDA